MPKTENSSIADIRNNIKKLLAVELSNVSTSPTSPLPIFKSLAKLGLTGVAISEAHAGLQLGYKLTSEIVEEIAAADLGCAIFFSVHCMVSGVLTRYANEQQSKSFLPKLASGDYLGAFALTEPSAGSDAANLKMVFKIDKNDFLLSGEKCYITSAGFADLYIIFARQENSKGADGISAFIIECPGGKPPKGLTFGKPEKKMGAELSPIASMQCDSLRIPSTSLIGKIGDGYKIALSGLAGGRVNMSACANGVSECAISKAMAHAQQREQFGAKIFDFQGLQFMLADMQTKLSASRLLTEEAAEALDDNSTESKILSSMAKCFATDSAMDITTNAVQILGGAGYIKEYKVEQLMRDAKMLQIVEGTNQIQRHIIAREMQKLYDR